MKSKCHMWIIKLVIHENHKLVTGLSDRSPKVTNVTINQKDMSLEGHSETLLTVTRGGIQQTKLSLKADNSEGPSEGTQKTYMSLEKSRSQGQSIVPNDKIEHPYRMLHDHSEEQLSVNNDTNQQMDLSLDAGHTEGQSRNNNDIQ